MALGAAPVPSARRFRSRVGLEVQEFPEVLPDVTEVPTYLMVHGVVVCASGLQGFPNAAEGLDRNLHSLEKLLRCLVVHGCAD